MTRLAARAEAHKLGQVLQLANDAALELEALPTERLRDLRLSLYEALARFDARLFRRIAAIFKRLPILLVVWIARLAGPLLTARVAGDMPARRAARMAQKLPPAFVADVCRYLDPRSAPDLIHALSHDTILPIALELIRRRDWITTGRFVDFLDDLAIRAVLDQLDDDESLLRIAFYVESRNRLDHLVRLIPPERLRRAILLAVDESRDLLTEVIALIIHVSYALKRELGDLAAAQDERVLNRVMAAVHTQGLWADLLPVISVLSQPAQYKVVNLPILRHDPAVLAAILVTAHRRRLWCDVLPLVHHMDQPMREAVALHAAELPHAALVEAADAALLGEHWEPLLDIARRIAPASQREWADILRRYGEVDAELLDRLERRAQALGFGDAFAPPCPT